MDDTKTIIVAIDEAADRIVEAIEKMALDVADRLQEVRDTVDAADGTLELAGLLRAGDAIERHVRSIKGSFPS